MKKTVLAVFVLICLAGVLALAYAQEAKQAAANQTASDKAQGPCCPGMQKGMGMGKMGEKAGMMHMGMMKMMRPPMQMVASNDGGVIVLVGNKLVKYDKNLQVVKEVEVKAYMEGACKMMAAKERGEKEENDRGAGDLAEGKTEAAEHEAGK